MDPGPEIIPVDGIDRESTLALRRGTRVASPHR
jgi:hypothetical protein